MSHAENGQWWAGGKFTYNQKKKGDFLFFHPLGVLAPSPMDKIELLQSHSLYSHIYNIVVMGGGIAF